MGSFLSGKSAVALQTTDDAPALVAPVDLDPQLQRYWDMVMVQLPANIATGHEAQVVLQLCQALHVRDKAYRQILDGGIETVDATHGGEKRRNPAIITWRQASDMVTTLMNMLGMSPVSRARIQGRDSETADPFVEFLRRRNGPTAQD